MYSYRWLTALTIMTQESLASSWASGKKLNNKPVGDRDLPSALLGDPVLSVFDPSW